MVFPKKACGEHMDSFPPHAGVHHATRVSAQRQLRAHQALVEGETAALQSWAAKMWSSKSSKILAEDYWMHDSAEC